VLKALLATQHVAFENHLFDKAHDKLECREPEMRYFNHLHIEGFRRLSNLQLDMHHLSEGVLRFLWLVALLQSPGLLAVTMIAEPEVSLHRELLGLLADLLREASTRTQLIVATHSDRLVRFLEPKEVVAMDINEDGTARAAWADTVDLDAWLKEYTLDEVWSMGRMGARS
jgi:predicted ATPase